MSNPAITGSKKELSSKQRIELFRVLKARFKDHLHRHNDLEWAKVQAKLETKAEKLWTLNEMERTGGEPDVVGYDKKMDEYIFFDCSEQSPVGRRYVCYDYEGEEVRRKKKSTKTVKSGGGLAGNAVDMAASIGIVLLTEAQYRLLQKLGSFDTKTSSWVKTPLAIRKLGGAIFANRRYDHVFVYANSAPSFYSDRGFRGSLRI